MTVKYLRALATFVTILTSANGDIISSIKTSRSSESLAIPTTNDKYYVGLAGSIDPSSEAEQDENIPPTTPPSITLPSTSSPIVPSADYPDSTTPTQNDYPAPTTYVSSPDNTNNNTDYGTYPTSTHSPFPTSEPLPPSVDYPTVKYKNNHRNGNSIQNTRQKLVKMRLRLIKKKWQLAGRKRALTLQKKFISTQRKDLKVRRKQINLIRQLIKARKNRRKKLKRKKH